MRGELAWGGWLGGDLGVVGVVEFGVEVVVVGRVEFGGCGSGSGRGREEREG